MYNFLHNNRKWAQIILAILLIPFAFFGVDSYFRGGGGSESIATVAGQPITQQEFAQALQERQNALRRVVGDRVDPALLDSTELRQAVLDGIIRQRLLIDQAVRNRMLVSDRELQEVLSEQPMFQENGKFSHARYEELLKRQGMNPLSFENGLRRDLMVQRASDPYNATAIVSTTVTERLLRLTTQQREVSQSVLEAEKFVPLVKLEAAAAKQYYDAHQDEFRIPEQARLEYLALSLDSIAAQVGVDAGEVKQFYEQNLQRYAKGEERRASHILITIDPKATAEEKKAARVKAEQLLKQVRQNPASFADLASKNSQDPGSATNGGDLGFFARGAMVKPFDDAVSQMKSGEIAGPVESPFGYHIIRLTEIRGGGGGFDDAKKQVELDLKRQKAGKKFSELGEQLRDLAFEQGDSLKPAADALKLQVQNSGWVSRGGSDNKLLTNPKLLQSVFSEEVVRNKRNSEAIDVGGNTLVAARVVEYKPAGTRPFEEVSSEINRRLTQQQAAQLAAKQGREMLATLKQGGDITSLSWSSVKLVSRQAAQGYASPVLAQVFKADVNKLPAYVGVETEQGGFVLLKITRVVDNEAVDIAKRKGISEELRQLLGQEQLNAYIASLKLKGDVKVQPDRLERKEQ